MMRRDARLAVLVALLAAGCAGSGGGDGDSAGGGGCKRPDTLSVTYQTNIQPLFNRSCATANGLCHVGTPPAQGLDLSAGQAIPQTVGRRSSLSKLLRIRAGKPDESFLFLKTASSLDASLRGEIVGDPMPQGCPGNPGGGAVCVTNDDVEALRTWILECATDDPK